MYSAIHTYVPQWMDALESLVEASIQGGLPSFAISGMSGGRTREIESRLRASIINSGYHWPRGRIIAGITPAWLEKAGSLYDLALALAILEASEQMGEFPRRERYAVVGELGLNGEIRPVPGLYPCLEAAAKSGRTLLLPAGNEADAAGIPELHFATVRQLSEVLDYYRGVREPQLERTTESTPPEYLEASEETIRLYQSFSGQAEAWLALQVALAGWHPLLLMGAPGAGKSMLLALARDLLPPLTEAEHFELRRVYGLARQLHRLEAAGYHRPYEAPHHSVTAAALIGGGSPLRPGVFSLAHRGLLVLDEFTELSGQAIDYLRESLSSGEVMLARGRDEILLPSRFLLLAAANPCRCGYALEAGKCRCSLMDRQRYLKKISGPIRDRLQLFAPLYTEKSPGRFSRSLPNLGECRLAYRRIQHKIAEAWQCQAERLQSRQQPLSDCLNGAVREVDYEKDWGFSLPLLRQAETLTASQGLSLRNLHALLAVARTLADLEGRTAPRGEDLELAFAYRQKGRDMLAMEE